MAAPTTATGVGSSVGVLSWGQFVDERERVPELRWPRSVIEYDRMRNDSQVEALDSAATLPIKRYRWEIDPNGAAVAVVERISEDMGLPVKGSDDEVDDTATNFSHDDHLHHALLGRIYGHMFFNIVGENVDGWWRLRKLMPLMPNTIGTIEVDDDGGLKGLRQNINRKGIGSAPPLIPAEHLLAHVWRKEGANWTGRSALRSLYGNWLIKQRLLRVDAGKHERNGMGVPIARAIAENVGRRALTKAAAMAMSFRAGKNAGGVLPFGTDMKLLGVEGNIPDTIGSVKYHDEAMARAWLAMFIQLGQTESGSRALGGTFVDFFALGLEATAHWYAKVMTKIVFKRWVVWNVGESSPTPKLVFTPGPRELAVEELKQLQEAGVLTLSEEDEAWVRGKHGLPKAPERAPAPAPPAPEPQDDPDPIEARGRSHRAAEDTPAIPLPDRELRRHPYDHEIAAAVDFAQLDKDFDDAVEALVTSWSAHQDGQINELVDAIAATSENDLAALSIVEAETGLGADAIATVMHDVAEKGAAGAVQEAQSQGGSVDDPDLDDVRESLTARAAAIDTLLTRSIGEAAARKATNLAGGALGPDDIANEVGTYLRGLSDEYLRDQFSGVVAQARGAGRRKVFAIAEPDSIYASELLDKATCKACRAVDGREYDDIDTALEDYPTGQYKDCQGGPRCRGVLIGRYADESESTS